MCTSDLIAGDLGGGLVFNLHMMGFCQLRVCSALWGKGRITGVAPSCKKKKEKEKKRCGSDASSHKSPVVSLSARVCLVVIASRAGRWLKPWGCPGPHLPGEARARGLPASLRAHAGRWGFEGFRQKIVGGNFPGLCWAS